MTPYKAQHLQGIFLTGSDNLLVAMDNTDFGNLLNQYAAKLAGTPVENRRAVVEDYQNAIEISQMPKGQLIHTAKLLWDDHLIRYRSQVRNETHS